MLRKLRTKHLPVMADRQVPSIFNLLTVHCKVDTIKFSCFCFCMMINVRELHKTILLPSLEMNFILLPSGLICCLAMVLKRFLSPANIIQHTYPKSFPLTEASKPSCSTDDDMSSISVHKSLQLLCSLPQTSFQLPSHLER